MADEQKEEKEYQKKKDPRIRILIISVLIEVGIFVGINLLFLLPSTVSITTPPTISLILPSSGKILTGVIFGIVGMIVGFVVFKKGLRRRIFLILVLIGIFAVIGLLTLPTISVATPASWTILVGGTVGITVIVAVGFLLIYWWWAENNLFFTFVPEGRAKHVVRGDAYRKTLIQWKGHTLATRKTRGVDVGDVVEVETQKGLNWFTSPIKRLKTFFRGFFGGFEFYGWWPLDDIYIYDFSWTNRTQDGQIQRHEKELLDYLILKDDIYILEVKDAEDKDLLPLTIKLALTARILGPYKSSFCIQNWLETLLNRMGPAVRDKITERSYGDWIKEKGDLADLIISDPETKRLLKKFRKYYGIEVRAIEIIEIDPGEEYRKATLQKFLAEREKERIKAVYEEIEAHGDIGKLIRTLEALEKSPGEGSKWVILPGLTDLISQVFPGRTPETLKSEDIKMLREIIKEFRSSKKKV